MGVEIKPISISKYKIFHVLVTAILNNSIISVIILKLNKVLKSAYRVSLVGQKNTRRRIARNCEKNQRNNYQRVEYILQHCAEIVQWFVERQSPGVRIPAG